MPWRYLPWILVVPIATATICTQAETPQEALVRVVKNTHASAMVLDWNTGKIVASAGHDADGLPGSVIKPILLDYALKHGIVWAETTVYCRRDLHVGGRALACTHPADRTTFDAEMALAESCNTWFAEMGKRFSGRDLEAALDGAGLRHTAMEHPGVDERQLAALGLVDVTVTPLELALAYRKLLLSAPAPMVLRGLRGSVDFGMANMARVPGVDVLGKTGTAANAGTARTHGWFAGAVPGKFVVVIYVPQGNGAGAALLAAQFIAAEEHSR